METNEGKGKCGGNIASLDNCGWLQLYKASIEAIEKSAALVHLLKELTRHEKEMLQQRELILHFTTKPEDNCTWRSRTFDT